MYSPPQALKFGYGPEWNKHVMTNSIRTVSSFQVINISKVFMEFLHWVLYMWCP